MTSFDYVTTTEAAEVLGVSSIRVRQFCQEGRLGRKIGDRWIISRDELRSFQKIPRERGRRLPQVKVG